MFTIAPRERRRCGAACFAIRNMPVRLAPMRRFHSVSASFSTGPLTGEAMPALLTSASSRPQRLSTWRTQARTSLSRATSQRMNASSVSAAVLRPACASRSAITTR